MATTTLSGTVTNTETGKPIRAEIRFLYQLGNKTRRRIVQTGTDGRFSLRVRGVRDSVYVVIVARAPRYREKIFGMRGQEERVVLQAGEGRVMNVELSPGPTVRGRVTNEEGKPISRVDVQLTLAGPTWCSWPHAFGVGDLREPAPIRTDAEGRFMVPHLHVDEAQQRQARYVLTFRHPKYVMTNVQAVEQLPQEGGWIDLHVVMPRGVSAAGKVVLTSGRPLGGGEIEFFVAERRADEPCCVPTRKTARINSRGRFAIHGLEPRTHNVMIHGDHCAPFFQDDLELPAKGPKEFRFTVEPGAVFSGRLVDEHGRPMPGQELRADARAGLCSDKDGRFEIRGLTPRSEFLLRVPRRFEARYRPEDSPVEIVLGEPQSIHGTAREERTSAPPSAPYRLWYRGTGYSAGQDFEAGQSRFELPRVPPGKHELFVVGQDWVAEARSVRVPIGGLKRGLSLRLRKGATLAGQVLDAKSGRPVAGAKVKTRARVPGILCVIDEKGTETDGDGRFRVAGLGERPYFVHVSHPGYASATVDDFEVKPGQRRKRLQIALVRGGRVAGKVVSPEGQPLPQQLVKLSYADGRPHPFPLPEGLTDDEGRFRLKHVPLGELTAHIGDVKRNVTVATGKTTKVWVSWEE